VKKSTLAITGLLLFSSPADAVSRIQHDQNQIARTSIIPEIHRQSARDRRETLCLALNVYHEGRSTSSAEQMMIAKVTINRANLNRWPPNICQVVYQTHNVNGRNVAQFSWVTNVTNPTPREAEAWQKAQRIAYLAYVDADIADATNGATYFYSKRMREPKWARNMTAVTTYSKHHVFLIKEES
jgi:spore germination cell wall hydrolase CwlJ-like protein